MKKKTVIKTMPFFDRQARIPWWEQERLFNARVLVVGAGALGNEVLKNLALLGIGFIYVVDFDTIENSNLSRTVLFRTKDAKNGSPKAIVAAKRTKALNPNTHAVVQSFHGDVVWDIGSGLYRRIDLVLGCLDNLEARLAVNKSCWQAGIPWVDGGLWELSGSVDVYDSTIDRACYACSMTPDHYLQAKKRYSCVNQTVKSRLEQGFMPTTQTVAAIIASIQCQEAIKILHKLPSFPGKRLVFSGDPNYYTKSDLTPISLREMPINPDCLCHQEEHFSTHDILELPLAKAKHTTARQLIKMVESISKCDIKMLELGRDFVIESVCGQCGKSYSINRPLSRTRDIDVVCPTCQVECQSCHSVNVGRPDCFNCGQEYISEPRLEKFHYLTVDDSTAQIYLDYTLYDLGIPPLHILNLKSINGEMLYVELSGDLDDLLNNNSI